MNIYYIIALILFGCSAVISLIISILNYKGLKSNKTDDAQLEEEQEEAG